MRCTDTAAAKTPKETPNKWANTNLLGHDSLRGTSMGGRGLQDKTGRYRCGTNAKGTIRRVLSTLNCFGFFLIATGMLAFPGGPPRPHASSYVMPRQSVSK